MGSEARPQISDDEIRTRTSSWDDEGGGRQVPQRIIGRSSKCLKLPNQHSGMSRVERAVGIE